jgi:hypothetical protein
VKFLLIWLYNCVFFNSKETFPAGKKIGVIFRRQNEWGFVRVVPDGSNIIVGSLLTAVNGKSVLLMKFDDAIQITAKAVTSGKSFDITFMPPYRLEGAIKKYETGWMGSEWKSYYFKLDGGIIQCHSRRQGTLKYEWDLANETEHHAFVTPAPKDLMGEGEMGIMVEKGGEKIIFKAEDGRTETWGAFIHLSIIVANGGNPDMYALEAKRIKEKTGVEVDMKKVDMTAVLEQAERTHQQALENAAAGQKDTDSKRTCRWLPCCF